MDVSPERICPMICLTELCEWYTKAIRSGNGELKEFVSHTMVSGEYQSAMTDYPPVEGSDLPPAPEEIAICSRT